MVRELRDLSFTVYRCRAAIEMPAVIQARDDLIQRFVTAAISPREVAPTPEPAARMCGASSCDDDLPLYCDPDEPPARPARARRVG